MIDLKTPMSLPLAEGYESSRTWACLPAAVTEAPTLPVVEPAQLRARAEELGERYGFDLQNQQDLMYVQSCLVTAGMNDNDDIFLAEELWKARATPVLKPTNWQHSDADIIGVMYSVEARDLGGNVIDLDGPLPDQPFELWTEAAIYKLLDSVKAHAGDIQNRFAKGGLFVSMEAWFDNYDYGVFKAKNGRAEGGIEIIERNEKTSWMDKHLRACKGSGAYDGRRVGRVLRNITFGGQGVVDVPANKRSDAKDVQDFIPQATSENAVLSLLRRIEDRPVSVTDFTTSDSEASEMAVAFGTEERESMPNEPQAPAVDTEQIARDAAKAALDEKAQAEAQQKAEAEHRALAEEATELRSTKAELEGKVSDLEETVETQGKDLADVQAAHNARHEGLDSLVEAVAGATGDTPPEIAKIDSVTDGDSAWQAKISWIEQSTAGLIAKAAKAEELEEELATAEQAIRESEIREVFAGRLQDDEIDAYVAAGLAQDSDEAYEGWLGEKKLLAAKIPVSDGESNSEEKPVMAQKDDNGQAKSSKTQLFDALLARHNERSEGGEKALQPESLGQQSGVSSSELASPRHRLVKGGREPEQALSNAQPTATPNLAGASGGDAGDDQPNPARTLATELFAGLNGEDDQDDSQKPDFDPAAQ